MTGPRILLVPLVAAICAAPAFAQAGVADLSAESAATEEHGLPRSAGEITRVFGLPVTNSMVVTWVTTAFVIVVARVATRRMRMVPAGAQNFVEWLVERLDTVLEGILGRRLVGRTFWFFASLFILARRARAGEPGRARPGRVGPLQPRRPGAVPPPSQTRF
jgi:hypothetical protein